MIQLADRIESLAAALTHQVLGEMYANPFWQERFGERGRQRAEEDGRYHLTYLAEALRAESPETLVNYARWLRTVLATRGMCSRHLAENFARLAKAIRDEIPSGGEEAARYLETAEAALVYDRGPARPIQLAAAGLSEQAVAVLYTRHPDWLTYGGAAGQQRCRDDMLYYLSYIADAVALERADLFADYTRWIVAFLERRGIPREHLQDTLVVLGETLAALPPRARSAARRVLSTGQTALAGEG
jgi:hypothetical protein